MKINRIIVTLILCFCPFLASAYEAREGKVSFIAGPLVHQTPLTISSADLKSPLKGGLGLILLGDIDSSSSLDLTFLLLNKTYIREEAGVVLAEETDLAHIALGYRRHLNHIFSTSLLIYSAYPAGDVRTVHLSQANTNNLETSARDTVDYGFDLSLTADLLNFERYSVITDLRYSFAITPRKNENADQTTLLVGLRYELQEGNPADQKTEKD